MITDATFSIEGTLLHTICRGQATYFVYRWLHTVECSPTFFLTRKEGDGPEKLEQIAVMSPARPDSAIMKHFRYHMDKYQ